MILTRRIVDYCSNYNKIYCVGAGRFGREVTVFLKENNIEIDGFLVSKLDKHVHRILGKNVISLKDFDINKNIGILLTVGRKYKFELEEILHKKGCRHFFYIDEIILQELEKECSFSYKFPSNQYVNVLLYHRVIDKRLDPWHLSVDVDNFDQHIRWIKENYPIIKFNDDWSKVKEPSFVISFDDGYRDNYYNALPVLEKYNVPAVFFISTGGIGNNSLFWWDRLVELSDGDEKKALSLYDDVRNITNYERMKVLEKIKSKVLYKYKADEMDYSMSVSEIKSLNKNGLIEIGGHTVNHTSLAVEDRNVQYYEIVESIKYLNELLDIKINTFSYPLGDYNLDTLQILKDIGVKKAATVSGGLAGTGDDLLIPRNVVRNWGIEEFKKFINRCFCIYAEERTE